MPYLARVAAAAGQADEINTVMQCNAMETIASVLNVSCPRSCSLSHNSHGRSEQTDGS